MKKVKRRSTGFTCNFCDRKDEDVEMLVVGSNKTAKICNECIVQAVVHATGRGCDIISSAIDQLKISQSFKS